MTERSSWRSKTGFIFAAAGSAIGLANIWQFPYLVGKNGGSAFILLYLGCLALIGLPVFLSELLIGKTAQTTPFGAFKKLSKSPSMGLMGKMTILTGFIISAFYSSVAGWILVYLIEAIKGSFTQFSTAQDALILFNETTASAYTCTLAHFTFLFLSSLVLLLGVKKGIESGNRLMMPLLYLILILLSIVGLSQEGAMEGLLFLTTPKWSDITGSVVLLALGQAFFTLSLGQGTMITYGSYLKRQVNLVKVALPVLIMDTLVSCLAAIATMTIVFSAGLSPSAGPGLIFQTLPLIFSKMVGGYFFSILFFLLIFLAALSSEISALEPSIAYLIDEKGWKRKPAVIVVAFSSFLLGVPCALSLNLLQGVIVFDKNIFDNLAYLTQSILIPLGGLFALVLVGWIWGVDKALLELKSSDVSYFEKRMWFSPYFKMCVKYFSPLLMILIFLHAIGVV